MLKAGTTQAPELLTRALEHHRAGRLAEAETIYREILAAEPDNADALHLLGVTHHQCGRHAAAADLIASAIRKDSSRAEFHINLGAAFAALRRFPDAVASAEAAIRLNPDCAEVHGNLGNSLKALGHIDEAIAAYTRALQLNPDYAEAHNNLGVAYMQRREVDNAVAAYRRALELNPCGAEIHNNLGSALKEQGRLAEAAASFRRALELNGDFAEAHNNLGTALHDQRKMALAIESYRRALELAPDLAEAHSNLGLAFEQQGNLDDAVASCRRALELKPDYADAHNNLGAALKQQGRLNEAVASYHRALELIPDHALAHANLGNALKAQGKLDEALASYRRALELKPDYAEGHSNLLLALQYDAGTTLSVLAGAHAEYDRLHAAPLGTFRRSHANARVPDRRLRLGFVSPDFGCHPVGYFLIGILEHLQRDADVICYNDRYQQDRLTSRFQVVAAIWRDVVGINDQDLAEQIRADRIDVLFDLAGHTARNRLLVFARKPAPIQITWIGYEGTTGLSAMDYLLADRHVAPASLEPYCCERILRMPDSYVCYDPPDDAPPVGPPPARTIGHVTFASFNNLPKINAEVVRLWAEIMHRVPTARLMLKYRGLEDQAVCQRFFDLFSQQGIDPQRLVLLRATPHTEYLATFGHVDIALDPFPFSGGITTCDALWMGVPVITWPRETFASRHSLSYLSTIGLTETIARDRSHYVELAVGLASDLERMTSLRATLRERMSGSPLCDGQRFAGHLLALLGGVWKTRVCGEGSDYGS